MPVTQWALAWTNLRIQDTLATIPRQTHACTNYKTSRFQTNCSTMPRGRYTVEAEPYDTLRRLMTGSALTSAVSALLAHFAYVGIRVRVGISAVLALPRAVHVCDVDPVVGVGC